MLYLRGLKQIETTKDTGRNAKSRPALRCEFSTSLKNKYVKTYPVLVFQNSNLESVFTALCEDFKVDTFDEMVTVDYEVPFEGELFTADVDAHYVTTDGKNPIKGDDGKELISTTLTAVYVADWGQTKESVIRSFKRTWENNDLLVKTTEE